MEDPSSKSLYLRHLSAASWAVMAEAIYTHPLDTIKNLLQASADANKKTKISTVVEAVRSYSGQQGFYGGVGWMLLGRLPVLGVRFGVYELLTSYYRDGRKDKYVYVSEAFNAGLVAGAAEAIVASPFELLKIRAQINAATQVRYRSTDVLSYEGSGLATKLMPGFSAQASRWSRISQVVADLPMKHPDFIGSLKHYPWLIAGNGKPPLVRDVKGVRQIISLEGGQIFWRGLRLGMFRDAVFGAFFFSSWQLCHDVIMEWRAIGMDPPPRDLMDVEPLSIAELSVTAGISGSIAATVSHAFDTAKSRTQGSIWPKYIVTEQKILKWRDPGSWFERLLGKNPFDREVQWRGLRVRVAQHGLAAFVLVGTYNCALLLLSNDKHR